MAADLDLTGESLKARFAQLAKAELPFNPVDVINITGANVTRLQKSMKAFGWLDSRFITKTQAAANGWTIKPKSESVEIQVRNEVNGLFDTVTLVNGENVRGMPSLAAMLMLSDAAIQKMRGQEPLETESEVELSIGPARSVMREVFEPIREILKDPLLRAIEDNYHGLMPVPINALSEAEVKDIVAEDIAALRGLSNMDNRFSGATLMGANAQDQENYLSELVRQAPEIALEAVEGLKQENALADLKKQLPTPSAELMDGAKAEVSIKLQPDYKKVIGHGFAPYLNDTKNKTSYFVALEDEQGGIATVWGVDLERSLSEAGVRMGDAITLTKNGHRIVEINEKQADGSVVKKPAERTNWDTAIQPIAVGLPLKARAQGVQVNTVTEALSAAIDGAMEVDRFAAMAPYWLDGLHNAEGLNLAKKINLEIKARGLAEDRDAIAQLMAIHSKARGLGLGIVPEMQYLNDPELKRNRAEPASLLDGALVRDIEGGYRPKAGGRMVVHDRGDSVVLKGKSAESYRGAMELAVAKGWNAIELKGSKTMLSQAWVEAKLLGLEVVGYAPNEKDQAKYAARVAEESRLKERVQVQPLEQTAERVEVRPYVDVNGQEKMATMTYTVSYQGGESVQFSNAKDAAKAFSGLPSADSPVVVRSVIRADGAVTEGVVAGVAQGIRKGGLAQVSEKILDHEFDEAMDEIVEKKSALASLEPSHTETVTSGMHFGPIVAIEGDRIAQKTGRQVVWHDLSKLKGAVPKLGEMAEIGYSKGLGILKEKALEVALEGGGLGLAR